MKLEPYRDRSYRWQKVLRHVFKPEERWWAIYGSFAEWHADWSVLQGEGCFAVEEGWRVAERSERAAGVLDRHHGGWLSAAEDACDQAIVAGRVYPAERRRRCYVGDGGVTVYVSPGGAALVTCFRPRGVAGSAVSMSESTERADERARMKSRAFTRAAVRRAARRASLMASAGSPGDSDERK